MSGKKPLIYSNKIDIEYLIGFFTTLSLQKKLLRLLLLAAVGFILAQLLIIIFFVYPSYTSLEQEKGRTDLERTLNALNNEVHHLDKFTHDWSSWDDSYQFILDGNKEYIISNLQLSTFIDNELFFIFYLSQQGKVIWGKAIDSDTDKALKLEDFPNDYWSTGNPLLTTKKSGIHGLYMSSHGPLLIASRPVLRTDHSGPVKGVLVMAKLLDENFIHLLKEQTQVTWDIVPLTQIENENLSSPLLDYLFKEKENIHFNTQKTSLLISTIYNDFTGKPAFLVQIETSREITQQGFKTVRFAFLGSVFGVLSIFALLKTLLNKLIAEPVTELTSHVINIRESGNLSQLSKSKSKDEIGILANEINRLTQRLSSYQDQLRKLSSQLLVSEETERRQFARELHDRVSQTLTVLKIRVDTMAAGKKKASTEKEAAYLSIMLERLIREVRTLTFELSPPILYELGLCAALEWLVDNFHEQHNLIVNLKKCEISTETNPALAVMVFQTIRELLTNVVKHAETDSAKLEVTMNPTGIHVTVSDHGVGLTEDLDQELIMKKQGFGLFSIRERLNSLGGQFEISANPARGTRVVCFIPYSKTNILQDNESKGGKLHD